LTLAVAHSEIVDATLSFGPGLTVSWNGKALGTMKLDDVKVTGDVGGTIDASSAFLVSDVGHLTDFTKVRSPLL